MINTFENEGEVNELMTQVHKHTNFPTFDEFKKNPDKWRVNEEDIFVQLDRLECLFKSKVKNVTYFWRGKYKCKTLQDLQRITRNEGYTGTDLEMQPMAQPTYGTSNLYDSKIDIKINVYSKIEFRLMGGIVAND